MSDQLKPAPAVTRFSRLTVILFSAFVGVMGFILIDGLFETQKQDKPVQEVVQIDPPKIELPTKFGISDLPEPPKELVQPEAEPEPEPEKKEEPRVYNIVRKKHTEEEKKRYDAEQVELRRYRIERQKKALEAPVKVELASLEEQGQQTGQQAVSLATPGAAGARNNPLQMGSGAANGMMRTKGTGQLLQRSSNGTGEISNNLSASTQNLARNLAQSLSPKTETEYEDRKDKEQFGSRASQNQWTSQYSRVAGSRYEVKTGTLIPSVLLSGINSDLPGQITAQVSQHVWDTATGRHLLIPQGTRLLGIYDSRISTGQQRILIAWNRLIYPDGSSMTLESMPGADQMGYSGFNDQVDNHYFRIFGNALLMALISGISSYSIDVLGNTDSDETSVQSELGSALANQLGQAGLGLLNKNLSISPTLEIRPGYRFNVVVMKDLVFQQPYEGWR